MVSRPKSSTSLAIFYFCALSVGAGIFFLNIQFSHFFHYFLLTAAVLTYL